MDSNKLSAIAHATHHFQTPLTPEILDRALAFADLAPGARVIDLGCGNAAVAQHIAEGHDAHVDAVERSPLMADQAEARLAGRGAGGDVKVLRMGSAEYLAGAEPCDLLVGIGAIQLAGAELSVADTLAALARHVRPGGALLWGETYWRRPPSAGLLSLLGPLGAAYRSHAEYVAAGEAAGLLPLYAVTASEQDWDEYAWRYASAVEAYVRDHPADPDAPALKARVDGWRRLYLAEARDAMGFGLYLFRKPE